MHAKDWRMRLITRYMRAFEGGDLADIDAVLGPNFHEQLEGRDEIDRLGQLDHLRRLISASANRHVQLSRFEQQEESISADFQLCFEIGAQSWTITARLYFRFEDDAIDHVAVSNPDMRIVEPFPEKRSG